MHWRQESELAPILMQGPHRVLIEVQGCCPSSAHYCPSGACTSPKTRTAAQGCCGSAAPELCTRKFLKCADSRAGAARRAADGGEGAGSPGAASLPAPPEDDELRDMQAEVRWGHAAILLKLVLCITNQGITPRIKPKTHGKQPTSRVRHNAV